MALVSAGTEVTIIDESQYTSAGQNTVPYILIATAENKLTPDGSAIAQGTLTSSSEDVYLITSQRELVNTFGEPTFYKTSGGDAIQGYELNEYGLMAAYSTLGATNRVYVQRADIDMAELEASLTRPLGNPVANSYWFDLAETAFGLFVWSSAQNAFNLIDPIVITDVTDLVGGVATGLPLTSIGTLDSYAINTTNANNPIYWKNPANAWVLIGSDDWKGDIATVVGTVSNPTYTVTDDLVIDGTTVATSTGADLASLVIDINAEGISGVTAAAVNSRLELYTTNATMTIAEGAADDMLTSLGLTAGTFNCPVLTHATHVNVPRWRESDTTPRPTGSIWQKTTNVNDGADLVVKRYDSTTEAFVQQDCPLYANDRTANKNLDATGGSAIASGVTYAQYDVEDPDLTVATGTLKIFTRTAGQTSVTGATDTPTFTPADEFTIQVSQPNSTALTTLATVIVSGATSADVAADINGAGIANLQANVVANDRLNIVHTAGGTVHLEDTVGGAIAAAGITDALDNVREETVGGTVLLLSNWNVLTYTADTVTPGQDPVDSTRWYYPEVGEVDIMIHDAGIWKGYVNSYTDVRGHDHTSLDPAGPLIAATAPEEQSDGTALVYGDLWIDTSDLENYPVIRRWQEDEFATPTWVLLDNGDQTTVDGVLFGDARWDTDGESDTITDVMPPITDLLVSDYTDLDVPDPDLYPDGMLLFNTRRSGYNVKEYRVDHFNLTDFSGPLPTEVNTWVSVSGFKDDGSANFGRLAQRNLVVEAMKAAIDTNSDIREEQRQFNLLAVPGYPELSVNMVALNNERSNTGFIVGDTPLRLENTGTEIQRWATNNGGLGLSTGDGLNTADEYLGVFYPSGRTTDLTGTDIVVPPSHMMLRTIVLSDEKSYPWLAPAGTRRGQIDNVSAIGYLDATTGEFQTMATREAIRDVCYTNNMNPITWIQGAGHVNYGNLTTQPGSALDRINVARLINHIRVQADQIGNLFVFEPNDKVTRDELKGQMERMLSDLVAKRGLYDYLVVCDKSNNTPTRIDRNELWVDVAIEPVKAAEFIYIPVRIRNTGEISGGGTGA